MPPDPGCVPPRVPLASQGSARRHNGDPAQARTYVRGLREAPKEVPITTSRRTSGQTRGTPGIGIAERPEPQNPASERPAAAQCWLLTGLHGHESQLVSSLATTDTHWIGWKRSGVETAGDESEEACDGVRREGIGLWTAPAEAAGAHASEALRDRACKWPFVQMHTTIINAYASPLNRPRKPKAKHERI